MAASGRVGVAIGGGGGDGGRGTDCLRGNGDGVAGCIVAIARGIADGSGLYCERYYGGLGTGSEGDCLGGASAAEVAERTACGEAEVAAGQGLAGGGTDEREA